MYKVQQFSMQIAFFFAQDKSKHAVNMYNMYLLTYRTFNLEKKSLIVYNVNTRKSNCTFCCMLVSVFIHTMWPLFESDTHNYYAMTSIHFSVFN